MHYAIRETIDSVTSNNGRTNNIPWGLPTQVHMTTCVNSDLKQAIRAGNKDRRADCGRATKGATHTLLVDGATYTPELTRVQYICVARFASCKDEITWQQHWSL